MTEEPTTPDLVSLARHGYEAMGRGDIDAVMSVYATDAVLDMSPVGMGTHEGEEAIRRFVEAWRGSYGADYRYEQEEILVLGHGVMLSVVQEAGRLAGGKGLVEQRAAHVAIWANGKIERQTGYTDIDEGRAAAQRLAEERG